MLFAAAILEEKDASNQTYLGRISQFLDFASELAERAERRLVLKEHEESDESENPLLEYLSMPSVSTPNQGVGPCR